MQSILGGVTQGRTIVGQRIVIAGPEKVGKTTLACGAPNALLVPLEMGYASIMVAKTPELKSWGQVGQLCEELRQGAISGRIKAGTSIVWDSGTALERIIHDATIALDKDWKPGNPRGLTMATALGGYGKAYPVANQMFETWTRFADELTRYGINTIVTCHVFASEVNDPQHGTFQQWDLLLHSPKNQKEYGKREFMTQWADFIGFLHEPMFIMKSEDGKGPNRAVSANQGRQIAVDRQPQWVAGNRYGMFGLIPIPPQNGWNYLADAIYKASGIDLYNRAMGPPT